MNHLQPLDVVKLGEKIRIPNGEYIPTNTWTECPLYFIHASDLWPENQRHHLDWHIWPKDGSDYAIAIGFKQQFNYAYQSIAMNEIDFIHTLEPTIVRINIIKSEFSIEFSNVENVITLFDTIYRKIPCFNWDWIISNPITNDYCLLNINYSRKTEFYQENEDDDDEDKEILPYIPPPMKRIGGQSTSKSN